MRTEHLKKMMEAPSKVQTLQSWAFYKGWRVGSITAKGVQESSASPGRGSRAQTLCPSWAEVGVAQGGLSTGSLEPLHLNTGCCGCRA